MILTPDELEELRRLGRLEAEAFDLRLREREHRGWEERLTGIAWGADEGSEARHDPREDSAEVWRLRRDVERLASFHQAVLRSRAWRLIQALRRPLGRAW